VVNYFFLCENFSQSTRNLGKRLSAAEFVIFSNTYLCLGSGRGNLGNLGI
jgi:hypothetical protein